MRSEARAAPAQSYIWYQPAIALPIVEIRREKLTIEEFPGYNAVILSHSKLKIIVEQRIPSWHAALANVKGIYLITDTATGRHYVGKASGQGASGNAGAATLRTAMAAMWS